MDLIKNDSMKEFLKYYLSDICFDITFQLRTRIYTMIIMVQLLTLISMIVLKIIFKDNSTANLITSIVCCVITWCCLFLVLGTSFIVEKVRKKNQYRINNYYKYLDSFVSENMGEEMINSEDETTKTN